MCGQNTGLAGGVFFSKYKFRWLVSRRCDKYKMSRGLGEPRYIFANRPPVNMGTSIAPVDLARISAVDCELPRRLGGVVDEGLISNMQQIAKRSRHL